MIIESLQNEKIKNLSRLYTDNRFRKKSGLFVVEGQQENDRAIQHGFENNTFFICEELYKREIPQGTVHFISKNVFEKTAYRGDSGGILGIFEVPDSDLKSFAPKKDSTIIVIEGAEKPGNLGAILRSCEAFGIDALFVADTKVDIYNPNVIRSSVGCLFGMNIFSLENDTALNFLRENGFNIFTTIMSENSEMLQSADFDQKTAVVFGTEHSGISDFWKNTGTNILIPMAGTIDSLNLSNAVAITCYETLRQKMK